MYVVFLFFFFSFSLSFNRCFEVSQNAFVHKAKSCLLFFFCYCCCYCPAKALPKVGINRNVRFSNTT